MTILSTPSLNINITTKVDWVIFIQVYIWTKFIHWQKKNTIDIHSFTPWSLFVCFLSFFFDQVCFLSCNAAGMGVLKSAPVISYISFLALYFSFYTVALTSSNSLQDDFINCLHQNTNVDFPLDKTFFTPDRNASMFIEVLNSTAQNQRYLTTSMPNQISYSNRFMSLTSKRPSYVPRNWEFISHYKKTRGFWWPKSSKIRRNRPIPTNFWRTRSSVSFRRKKRIRWNFVRPSDDFLTNTEKCHSDELPTIFRCGHTRPEFIGKTIYRRSTFLGLYRRTESSENTDGLWFVGIFRGTFSVGIFQWLRSSV